MLEMDLQHWNAPVVLDLGIELAAVLLLRQHLAARNPDARLRHVAAAYFLFPRRAVSRQRGRECRILGLAAGRVHHVAADEILARGFLVDVLEIRNRDARGFAVVEPARAAFENRQQAADAAAAHLVPPLLPQRAAGFSVAVFVA